MKKNATIHDDHWDLNGSGGGMNPNGLYACTLSCQDSVYEVGGYTSGYFEITETGRDIPENRTLSLILAFICTIIFFTFFGFISFKTDLGKASFWFSFLCFGLGLIELIFMLGILFINEFNILLINLLKINFYMVSVVGFGIGLTILIMIYARLMSLDKDDEKWQGKKW